jgi:hypothetical protein
MLTLCSECDHPLRAEESSLEAFGVFDFFDDRKGSDTYTQQVTPCPGCDLWLYYGFGLKPSEATNADSE